MDFRELLKNANLKATPKRLAMLDILVSTATYLSPEDIWKQMQGKFRNIGLPTVYRNLEHLSNEKVIMKVIHPDRKLYYYHCRNVEHHHHFICTGCRRVEDLVFCGEKEIEEEVRERLHGSTVSHLLQVFGFCRDCLGTKRGCSA